MRIKETDEYEEDASEHDGEDEQETPRPTKEEWEFHMSREQLKDRIRRNFEKTNAKAFCHLSQTHDKRRTIPKGMWVMGHLHLPNSASVSLFDHLSMVWLNIGFFLFHSSFSLCSCEW